MRGGTIAELFLVVNALLPYAAWGGEAQPRKRALASLDRIKATVETQKSQSYYTIHRGQAVPLDHPAKLLAELEALRAKLAGASDAEADPICRQVGRMGLVAWVFSPLTQVSKQTVPPSLADVVEVKLSACIGDLAPSGFYLSNLRPEPLAVAITAGAGVPNLRVRWVTTHEGLPKDWQGSTPTVIARVVPLIDGKYAVIPPYECRQIFIEADTRGMRPGHYRAEIRVTAGSIELLKPADRERWLPRPPQKPTPSGAEAAPERKGDGVGQLVDDIADEAGRRSYPALTKTIAVDLEVHPIVLPAKAPFGVYTWNASAADSPEYIQLLVENKVNLFAIGDPAFKIVAGKVRLDPGYTRSIRKVVEITKPYGKILSLYGFVLSFTKTVEKQGIQFMEGDYARLLEDYFRQYVGLLKDAGLDYADYALELWDEPTTMDTFRKVKQACDLLHKVDPKVRFMLNPQCKLQDGYELVADHIAVWIPHNGMVYDCYTDKPLLDMVQAGFDPAKWGRDNCKSIQMFLHNQRKERGAYCMMYSQYGGNSNLDPVGYFRHWAWKMWWMRFDGISFWNAWPVTNGPVPGLGINKGLVGWRQGVEDVQHLYLLEDAIEAMTQSGAPAAEIAKARAVLDQATDKGVKWDWWCMKPLEAEVAFNEGRSMVVGELLRLRKAGLVPEKGPLSHYYADP